MENNTPKPTDRLSGGETEDRAEFLRMRALILAEPDVFACHALSWNRQEQRWLYLIQTPFATFPKFVVGWTDSENESPEILLCCTLKQNAVEFWTDLNDGEHQ